MNANFMAPFNGQDTFNLTVDLGNLIESYRINKDTQSHDEDKDSEVVSVEVRQGARTCKFKKHLNKVIQQLETEQSRVSIEDYDDEERSTSSCEKSATITN